MFLNHSRPQNRQSCVESVNLRKCPELGTTPQNFAMWTTWTKSLRSRVSCGLWTSNLECEKYDAWSIYTGLLWYLPSDVQLIGKQKLKNCPKLGPLTLRHKTIRSGWQDYSLQCAPETVEATRTRVNSNSSQLELELELELEVYPSPYWHGCCTLTSTVNFCLRGKAPSQLFYISS